MLLREIIATFKLENCWSFAEKTNYIGHLIQSGEVELSKPTAAAVFYFKNPTIETELISFFAVWIIFYTFVTIFTIVAALLDKMQ